MPSMSKKQRLSVMGLLVVLLSAALVFTYGGIPYSDLPLPGNITAQERELKRLRGTVKKLRRAHRRRDRQMEDLRRLAAPFWVLDTQGAAADVVAELRKLTRDAQVTPQSTVSEFLTTFLPLVDVIDHYFARESGVLVMADDQTLRENRLAQLQHIAALSDGIVGLSRLEGF